MTTKSKNNNEIKNAFDHLFGQLSEQDKLENEASLLMFRFLSIIDAKREELGWSRKELAEKVGTSASYITQLFRGNKMVNMITLAKFQKALGLNFDVIEKQSYENVVREYSPISDGKGFWVYHKFGTPNYETEEKLPALSDDTLANVG